MLWTERPLRKALTFLLTLLLLTSQGSVNSQTSPAATPSNPPSQPSVTPLRSFSILVDAAHGGADTGALLNPAIPEKDVNLVIARRLRQELTARGIPSSLLRDGDATVALDQRAAMANSLNPILYLCIHSTSQGSGLRIYSALLPLDGGESGSFLNWQTAQSVSIVRSRWVQQQVFAAIQKTGFPVRSFAAALRPLNNLAMPAVAIEVSPTTGDVSQLASQDYQQMICAALANAVGSLASALRDRNQP